MGNTLAPKSPKRDFITPALGGRGALLPGSTIGMLGGGQLGRMFGLVAERLGYKVITLDPAADGPMAQVVDDQIVAAYNDVKAAKKLAKQCDVISYEFENVDPKVIEVITKITPVYPAEPVLVTSQHRWLEKELFHKLSIPVTQFHKVVTVDDIDVAEKEVGYPAVLKTCRFGYDGKGQKVIHNSTEAHGAFVELEGEELIWEKLVDFVKEISVICTRNQAEDIVVYPVSENIHKNNILDVTIAPARVNAATTEQAHTIAKTIAEALDVVGTFCVEMFVLADGTVIANEIAPRPHNSGHYTVEACYTSQFENQLRAICGLPLGSTAMRCAAAVMINILGDGSGNALVGVDEIMKQPNVYLQLYGKTEAKAGRKMGHVTLIGDDVKELLKQAKTVKQTLRWMR